MKDLDIVDRAGPRGRRVRAHAPILDGICGQEIILRNFLYLRSALSLPTIYVLPAHTGSHFWAHVVSQQKLEVARAKARERMARSVGPSLRHRAMLKEKSAAEQEEARVRAREAQATYRRRNRMRLCMAQSHRRKLAFIAEHGELAYEEKHVKRLARRSAEIEKRRRARKQGRGSTKRASQAREKVLKRARGTTSVKRGGEVRERKAVKADAREFRDGHLGEIDLVQVDRWRSGLEGTSRCSEGCSGVWPSTYTGGGTRAGRLDGGRMEAAPFHHLLQIAVLYALSAALFSGDLSRVGSRPMRRRNDLFSPHLFTAATSNMNLLSTMVWGRLSIAGCMREGWVGLIIAGCMR
ncbi:hypothetical protein B0H13DRAFT_1907686 [Mycena leptocephala]|nr:hypothetical protein B0H13DRAFT_1907686 [Mycena leptocephala]